jgi:hypothetical protein
MVLSGQSGSNSFGSVSRKRYLSTRYCCHRVRRARPPSRAAR